MTEQDDETQEVNLSCRSFGSHTITLGAVVSSQETIHVPLARTIRTWSVNKAEQRTTPTPHRSIITFIAQSGDGTYLVTCDWSGVVGVYNPEWHLQYTFSTPHPPAASLQFITPSRLVVLSRGADNFKPGCVVMYELGVSGVGGKVSQELVDEVWQIACYGGFLYVWKWVEPVFSLLKFNDQFEFVEEFELLSEKSASIGHAISDKYIVLVFSRDLVILDTQNMKQISSVKEVSKSPIWGIQFVSDSEVILQESRDNFVILDILTGVTTRRFKGPSSFVCFMELLDQCLWVGTVDGVFRVRFTADPSNQALGQRELETEMTSFLYHEVSGCGVSLTEGCVVSGDMAGNVLIWDTSSDQTDYEPVFRTKIDDSVRFIESVVVRSHVLYVFIGTMCGSFLKWKVGSEAGPQVVTHKADTITCIRTTEDLLCLSTVTGHIELYNLEVRQGEIELTKMYDLLVHHPAPSSQTDLRFGSLNLKAEIWSVAFSPCSTYLATCSEDQTVKVTELRTGALVRTLTHHTLAVTCVTWCNTGSLSLVVSCSDDNTIVVTETGRWVKLRVLSLPGEVIGFCTLTYLGVVIPQELARNSGDPSTTSDELVKHAFSALSGKVQVACGSENGYLFIRDLVSGGVVFKERVHQGSIEGLACRGSQVATCSSDCCVQLFFLGS